MNNPSVVEESTNRFADFSKQSTLWLSRAGAIALALMMLLTFFDVIGRYFFNSPIVGTVEITELLMGLIVYLGIGYTTVIHGHIRVDIVITHLPNRLRALLDVLTLTISIIFSVLVCWQLWVKAADTVAAGDVTQLYELPVFPFAYVMAACSITLITGLLLQFVQALHTLLMNPHDHSSS